MDLYNRLKTFLMILRDCIGLYGSCLRKKWLTWLLEEPPSLISLSHWTSSLPSQTTRKWPQCISMDGNKVLRQECITCDPSQLLMQLSSPLMSRFLRTWMMQRKMRKMKRISKSKIAWGNKKKRRQSKYADTDHLD